MGSFSFTSSNQGVSRTPHQAKKKTNLWFQKRLVFVNEPEEREYDLSHLDDLDPTQREAVLRGLVQDFHQQATEIAGGDDSLLQARLKGALVAKESAEIEVRRLQAEIEQSRRYAADLEGQLRKQEEVLRERDKSHQAALDRRDEEHQSALIQRDQEHAVDKQSALAQQRSALGEERATALSQLSIQKDAVLRKREAEWSAESERELLVQKGKLDLQHKNDKADAIKAEAARREREIGDLRNDVRDLQGDLARKQGRIDELSTSLAAEREKTSDLEKENKDLKKKNAELSAEMMRQESALTLASPDQKERVRMLDIIDPDGAQICRLVHELVEVEKKRGRSLSDLEDIQERLSGATDRLIRADLLTEKDLYEKNRREAEARKEQIEREIKGLNKKRSDLHFSPISTEEALRMNEVATQISGLSQRIRRLDAAVNKRAIAPLVNRLQGYLTIVVDCESDADQARVEKRWGEVIENELAELAERRRAIQGAANEAILIADISAEEARLAALPRNFPDGASRTIFFRNQEDQLRILLRDLQSLADVDDKKEQLDDHRSHQAGRDHRRQALETQEQLLRQKRQLHQSKLGYIHNRTPVQYRDEPSIAILGAIEACKNGLLPGMSSTQFPYITEEVGRLARQLEAATNPAEKMKLETELNVTLAKYPQELFLRAEAQRRTFDELNQERDEWIDRQNQDRDLKQSAKLDPLLRLHAANSSRLLELDGERDQMIAVAQRDITGLSGASLAKVQKSNDQIRDRLHVKFDHERRKLEAENTVVEARTELLRTQTIYQQLDTGTYSTDKSFEISLRSNDPDVPKRLKAFRTDAEAVTIVRECQQDPGLSSSVQLLSHRSGLKSSLVQLQANTPEIFGLLTEPPIGTTLILIKHGILLDLIADDSIPGHELVTRADGVTSAAEKMLLTLVHAVSQRPALRAAVKKIVENAELVTFLDDIAIPKTRKDRIVSLLQNDAQLGKVDGVLKDHKLFAAFTQSGEEKRLQGESTAVLGNAELCDLILRIEITVPLSTDELMNKARQHPEYQDQWVPFRALLDKDLQLFLAVRQHLDAQNAQKESHALADRLKQQEYALDIAEDHVVEFENWRNSQDAERALVSVLFERDQEFESYNQGRVPSVTLAEFCRITADAVVRDIIDRLQASYAEWRNSTTAYHKKGSEMADRDLIPCQHIKMEVMAEIAKHDPQMLQLEQEIQRGEAILVSPIYGLTEKIAAERLIANLQRQGLEVELAELKSDVAQQQLVFDLGIFIRDVAEQSKEEYEEARRKHAETILASIFDSLDITERRFDALENHHRALSVRQIQEKEAVDQASKVLRKTKDDIEREEDKIKGLDDQAHMLRASNIPANIRKAEDLEDVHKDPRRALLERVQILSAERAQQQQDLEQVRQPYRLTTRRLKALEDIIANLGMGQFGQLPQEQLQTLRELNLKELLPATFIDSEFERVLDRLDRLDLDHWLEDPDIELMKSLDNKLTWMTPAENIQRALVSAGVGAQAWERVENRLRSIFGKMHRYADHMRGEHLAELEELRKRWRNRSPLARMFD